MTPQDFGLPIMTDTELFATLKAQGPIGEWAAAALLTQERATRVAQDQALANGYANSEFQASMGFAKAEIERLRAVCERARLALCEKDYDYAFRILDAIPSPGASP